MNSIALPLILSTTMVIPLGFMNMAHSVLSFGKCFNALGHQKRLTAQKHNALLHGSCSSVNQCRPFLEQTLLKQPPNCQPLTHTGWNREFFMEKSKMEIHNDIQANPHPPYLILLWLSKKSLVC